MTTSSLALPDNGITCVFIPINENVRLASEADTSREYLPSTSVMVPFVVPSSITPAPATGSPAESFTVPDTVTCWAYALTPQKAATSIAKSFSIAR